MDQEAIIQAALQQVLGTNDWDRFRSALNGMGGTQKDWYAQEEMYNRLGYRTVVDRRTGELSVKPAERSRAWHDESTFINVQQGVETFVPSIRQGRAQKRQTLGQFLFRNVVIGTPTYKYRIYDLSHFAAYDTLRAMNSPFRHVKRAYETTTGSLHRRGFATLLDRDEIAAGEAANAILGAGGIDLRADHAMLSRNIVNNDLESQRATMVLAAGSYSASAPDLDVTLSTEWDDASGDARSDIQALAQTLAAYHGLSPADIGVILTDASLTAALADPTYIGKLETTGTLNAPTVGSLAAYWGVGEVVNFDAYISDDNATLTSLYGDVAILYPIPGRGQGLDTRESTFDGFVEFVWNPAGGLALTPVYKGAEVDGVATSWIFPYESWQTPAVVNTTGAAIIRNTVT